jgi:SAM-dependent methyltransferase
MPVPARPTRMTNSPTPDIVAHWLAALEVRHLADLRVAEVTRALRALSSAYVQRRQKVASGATLDSAGKRAAFALYYGPLHFIAVTEVLRALELRATPGTIIDLGCGTGAAGAAWALATGGRAHLLGIDRHPWAAAEARWTYRHFRLTGAARQGDITRVPPVRAGTALVAAYVLNEMNDAARTDTENQLFDAVARGARVLVLEPIARAVTPWWDGTAARVQRAGGRADEWRLPVELPPLLRLFDQAAGLRHSELKLRTLWLDGSGGRQAAGSA